MDITAINVFFLILGIGVGYSIMIFVMNRGPVPWLMVPLVGYSIPLFTIGLHPIVVGLYLPLAVYLMYCGWIVFRNPSAINELWLNFEKKVTQIFSTNEVLPPACQASVGLQTTEEDNEFTNLISNTNHEHSSIIGITERKVLEVLGANCNSPIGVNASIQDSEIYLKAELLSHNGKEKYDAKGSAKITDSLSLAKKVAGKIVDQVGINYIKKLDILQDDFNYTP